MRPGLLLSRDDALTLFVAIGVAACIALVIVGALATRRAILELPDDFLSRGLPAPLSRARAILRTIAGLALTAAGAILLVLPGPGILLIAIGILLWKPGWRHRIVTAVLARPSALRTLNAYRERHGRAAIQARS